MSENRQLMSSAELRDKDVEASRPSISTSFSFSSARKHEGPPEHIKADPGRPSITDTWTAVGGEDAGSSTDVASLHMDHDPLQRKFTRLGALSTRAAQLTHAQDQQEHAVRQLQAELERDNEHLGRLLRQLLGVQNSIQQRRNTIATNSEKLDAVKKDAAATASALREVVDDIIELSRTG